MTASNTPDRSVSDDALASGGPAGAGCHKIGPIGNFQGQMIYECSCGKTQMDQPEALRHLSETRPIPQKLASPAGPTPAGDGGFDPSRPFTTRDGRVVTRLREAGPWLIGLVSDEDRLYWHANGRYHFESADPLDLINTPTPTVPPTPAGDMAGEDDVREAELQEYGAIAERDGYEKAVQDIDLMTGGDGEYRFCTIGGPSHCPDAEAIKDRIVERFEDLAREGARREPVAGDRWQPIDTAPKDGTPVLLRDGNFSPEPVFRWLDGEHGPHFYEDGGVGCYWSLGGTESPTQWRPLPAAPSPVPSDTGGEACKHAIHVSEGKSNARLADPLCFKAGDDYLSPGADYKTYGISVSIVNLRGEPDWHTNMVEVYGNVALRDEILKRIALPSAAPTHGAGSGGEPVAWQWRLNGPEPHMQSPWFACDVLQREKFKENPVVEIRPLYASPLASVDAVAVANELCRLVQCLIDNDPAEPIADGGHTVLDLWRHEARAALRAAQQSGEARS